MGRIEETLERLEKAIAPLNLSFKAIEVRSVCFRMGERWINIGTKVHPVASSRELNLPEFDAPVNLESLRCLRESRPPDRLLATVRNLLNGRETLQGIEFELGQVDSKGGIQPFSPMFEFLSRELSRSRYGFDFPSFTVSAASGDQLYSVIGRHEYDALDNRLHSLNPPVFGFVDLLENFLKSPDYRNWWPPFVQVTIPVPVKVGTYSQRDDGRVTLHVECSLDVDRSLVYVSNLSEDPFKGVSGRRNIPLPKSADTDLGQNMFTITVQSSATSRERMALMYRDFKLEMVEVLGPKFPTTNPAVAAYTTFDRRMSRLNELLAAGSNAIDFRQGTALLFSLLGYFVVDLETLGVTDAPDLICTPPANLPCLAIEVTLAEPDHRNKLTKLSSRVRDLKGILRQNEVFGVLVTSKPEISQTEREIASKEQIALITRNDLPTLGSFLLETRDVTRIAHFFRQKVP